MEKFELSNILTNCVKAHGYSKMFKIRIESHLMIIEDAILAQMKMI